jgi:hypothetical protein
MLIDLCIINSYINDGWTGNYVVSRHSSRYDLRCTTYSRQTPKYFTLLTFHVLLFYSDLSQIINSNYTLLVYSTRSDNEKEAAAEIVK